jgi:uncharacterized membrane protein
VFTEVEEQRVVRAIANAERDNRGEVRVHVEDRCPVAEPVDRASALYRLLELDRTRDDTAVLLYIAEKSRVAAVFGGAGIYGQGATGFWQGVTDEIASGYRNGQPVDGICQALGKIGELLRTHAPGPDPAGNEIPDVVTAGPLENGTEGRR